ncbi:MAG: GNAT family N-acetyltransferase [Minisyncoccia bacterium]|jgi:GNAT superfamily N-acetyltransferase
MITESSEIKGRGIRFSVEDGEREVARAYLYLLPNGLHEQPFGLMEDVWVDEGFRGKGLGTGLVRQVVARAKSEGCYKLIATSRHSRPKVHELYRRLGFKDHGLEFRIDFTAA